MNMRVSARALALPLEQAMLRLLLVAAVAWAAFLPSRVAAAEVMPVMVNLQAESKSGQSGIATLTPAGEETKVVIELHDAPEGAVQPAHIHLGACAKLDKTPKWPLEPVKDGKSTTMVPASLRTIMHSPSAINVHKSAAELQTYVACGNILTK